ncbi:unnamed protein product [Diplocarpon coronariae]
MYDMCHDLLMHHRCAHDPSIPNLAVWLERFPRWRAAFGEQRCAAISSPLPGTAELPVAPLVCLGLAVMPHLFPFQQNLHPSSPSHFRGTQASRGTQVRSFHCLSRAPGSSPVLESPALISEQDRRSVTTLLRAVSSWILSRNEIPAPSLEVERAMPFVDDRDFAPCEEPWNRDAPLLEKQQTPGSAEKSSKSTLMVDDEMRDLVSRGSGENGLEIVGLGGEVERVEQTKTEREPEICALGAAEAEALSPFVPGKMAVGDVVLEAQTQSAHALHAGNSAASVDIAARKVITGAGFGEASTHRVGHGVGLSRPTRARV